jgi:hypothetical protein
MHPDTHTHTHTPKVPTLSFCRWGGEAEEGEGLTRTAPGGGNRLAVRGRRCGQGTLVADTHLHTLVA